MSQNAQDYRNYLQSAISVLEEKFVDPKLSQIRNSSIFQLIFFSILLISGVLTSIQPSIASIFASVGIGAGGISVEWKHLEKVFKVFFKDRRTIKFNFGGILLEFKLAGLNKNKLDNVEKLMRDFHEKII